METVVELFRSKGFAAVSLDDLSDTTGLSRPSLYRAFGNKLSMYMGRDGCLWRAGPGNGGTRAARHG